LNSGKIAIFYTRLGQMGLFRFEVVTQRSVVIEQAERSVPG
jgi:hypothetical protein